MIGEPNSLSHAHVMNNDHADPQVNQVEESQRILAQVAEYLGHSPSLVRMAYGNATDNDVRNAENGNNAALSVATRHCVRSNIISMPYENN